MNNIRAMTFSKVIYIRLLAREQSRRTLRLKYSKYDARCNI